MENERRNKFDFPAVHNRIRKRFPFLLLALLLVTSNCAHKTVRMGKKITPDENIAISSIARIDSLLGFYFDWRFGRKRIGLLPELKATLQGKIGLKDRFYLKGRWKTGEEVEPINVYSIKGKEYTYNKTTKTWENKTEGSFPNPLGQLRLVLSFGEFKFIKFDNLKGIRSYLYSFKPNIYFLDPTEATKPEGFLWIDEKKGLPLRVKVFSERKTINWDMRLYGFNSFANINVPFRTRKIRIIGIKNGKRDIGLIVDRFLFLGYERPDVKMEEKGDAVFSIKAEILSDSIVGDILRRGDVGLFIGTWPKDPISELQRNNELLCKKYGKGAKLLFERGNVTKPVIAVRKVLSRDAFSSFELRNDFLGKYSIYARIKPESTDSLKKIVEEHIDEPLVVVVDNRAVSVLIIQDIWLIENNIPIVKGMEGNESLLLFSRLKEDSLKKDYNFITIE